MELDNIPLRNRYPEDISKAISNNAYMVLDRYPDLPYFIKSLQIPSFDLGMTRLSMPQGYAWNIPSVQGESGDITVMWYMDENMTTYFNLLNWMKLCYNTTNVCDVMSDAIITVTNNAKQPIINISLIRAWPSNLGQLDFDTYNVEPILPFVTFKCDGISWKYLDNKLDKFSGSA